MTLSSRLGYATAPIRPGWRYRLDPFFHLYRWTQERRRARMTPALQVIEDLVPVVEALMEVSVVFRFLVKALDDPELFKSLQEEELSQNGVLPENDKRDHS